MGRQFRFASLQHGATIGYLFDSTEWVPSSRMGSNAVADWAQQYGTYGDGNVQHEDASFVRTDGMADYLRSLAVHLLSSRMTAVADDLDAVAHAWPNHCMGDDALEFALTVKHRQDKTVYYSLAECKVSSAESKRHDKRWDEIPEWANGTVKSAYGLVSRARAGAMTTMERYDLANRLVDVFRRVEKSHFGSPCRLVDESMDWPQSNAIDEGFRVVDSLVQSLQLRQYAERAVESIQRNASAAPDAAMAS